MTCGKRSFPTGMPFAYTGRVRKPPAPIAAPSALATPRFQAALIVHPALLRRKALAHLLRRQGFTQVHEAEDAVEAVTVAKEELVDVIFTPWSAGRLAGADLFRALKARGRKAVPPIVVLDEGLPQAT